jgi:DNA polymerase elongation subunit (family B)
MRYNVRDTEILGGFEDKLGYIELANQMYHSSAGQFSHVLGTIKLAELAIVNYCHELKQIVPDFKRSDIDRQIDGALVLLPQIGEHKNVGSIDINSLYPSAIRSINISPETLRAQFTMYEHAVLEIYKGSLVDLTLEIEETGEQITKPAYEWKQWLLDRKWSVSGYGTCFDQSVPGIIPTILSEWYAQRKHYQKLKKEAEGRAAAILKKYIDEDKVE